MATKEIVFKSVQELGELIKKKELSPVEVVEAFLSRSEALNPQLNAFITITRQPAMDCAREAEKEIRAERYRGPLHGIPYAPKHIIATNGIRTTNGSKVTADWIPTYESTMTTRLSQAGAILIGKLNLLEFAMGSGVLSGFGPVRNPWHLDYSPSGSSSGSAAAVAAGMVPFSIGTDTLGSIRLPAAACGIVGLKPTYGRVSRHGVTTLSWTLDHAGPMTRTVADAALILGIIAGSDPKDPTCTAEPVPKGPTALNSDITGLRVGVPTHYCFDDTHPEVKLAVQTALGRLRALGARIVDVTIPHTKYAGSAGWIINMAEAACFHERRLKETPHLFDPLVRERLETAQFYLATDYLKAMRVRSLLMQEVAAVFDQCDVIVTPGSLFPATELPEASVAGSDTWWLRTQRFSYLPGTTYVGSMTGIPAIAVPCGFSSGIPVMPLSIMFHGKLFDEPTVLRVAYAYERATEWNRKRPPIGTAPLSGAKLS